MKGRRLCQTEGMKERRDELPGKTREERESCIPAFGREESRPHGRAGEKA